MGGWVGVYFRQGSRTSGLWSEIRGELGWNDGVLWRCLAFLRLRAAYREGNMRWEGVSMALDLEESLWHWNESRLLVFHMSI